MFATMKIATYWQLSQTCQTGKMEIVVLWALERTISKNQSIHGFPSLGCHSLQCHLQFKHSQEHNSYSSLYIYTIHDSRQIICKREKESSLLISTNNLSFWIWAKFPLILYMPSVSRPTNWQDKHILKYIHVSVMTNLPMYQNIAFSILSHLFFQWLLYTV